MRLAVSLLCIPALLHAQDSTEIRHHRPSHWHIGITAHNTGITIGNAARTNGLRLNFEDADLDVVNGINITIWKAQGVLKILP